MVRSRDVVQRGIGADARRATGVGRRGGGRGGLRGAGAAVERQPEARRGAAAAAWRIAGGAPVSGDLPARSVSEPWLASNSA